jgi:hypothetical protein
MELLPGFRPLRPFKALTVSRNVIDTRVGRGSV